MGRRLTRKTGSRTLQPQILQNVDKQTSASKHQQANIRQGDKNADEDTGGRPRKVAGVPA